uniref:Lectin n=1 Tax=Panagrolaimus sp. JU765 TaxID=591449 RepID=A0AC34R7U2_9BILA
MRVIRWSFLWFPVILIWTNALIFEQNTTTFLKVNEDGFTVKICGNGSQSTKFCYGGLATTEQKHDCLSTSYCGIQAVKTSNSLTGHYGGESITFKKDCAEINVKPSEQIALNSNDDNPKKGTCKWNVTEDGKLPVDITVTTGFNVRV